MTIKKGTSLKIQHSRKGTFIGIAKKDFDTEETWYPIVLAGDGVEGMNTNWERGEEIPCRKSLCKISVIK